MFVIHLVHNIELITTAKDNSLQLIEVFLLCIPFRCMVIYWHQSLAPALAILTTNQFFKLPISASVFLSEREKYEQS